MRSVLIILGIAILAVGISIAMQPHPKGLVPNLADYQDQVRQENDAKDQPKPRPISTKSAAPDKPFSPPMEGAVSAVLTIANRGPITVQFYPKAAPKTVEHMVSLIKSGFYNGIKVHRVEPGFVVQLGDPETKTQGVDAPGIGSHGSGHNVPFEKNDLQNVTGSVAMALNSPQSDTGDSQFFINLSNNHFLDGNYCVFGKVTNGMDAVTKVQKGDTVTSFTLK